MARLVRGTVASVANAFGVTTARVPGLDDEPMIQVGQGYLENVHAEAGGGRHCASGDFGLTDPCAGILLGRINRWAVQREPRVTLQVCQFARARHRAEGHLLLDLGLDAADARRTSARSVAIVLCLRAWNSARTRAANSGASASICCHATM